MRTTCTVHHLIFESLFSRESDLHPHQRFLVVLVETSVHRETPEQHKGRQQNCASQLTSGKEWDSLAGSSDKININTA